LFAQKRIKKGSRSLAVSLLVNLRLTALRCLQKADASESRFTPPSHLTAFCYAARLREMTIEKLQRD